MAKRKKDASTLDNSFTKRVKIVNCTEEYDNSSQKISIELGSNARINYKALNLVNVEKNGVDLKNFFVGNKFAFEKVLVDFSSSTAVQNVLKNKNDMSAGKNLHKKDKNQKLPKNKNLVSSSAKNHESKLCYSTNVLSHKNVIDSKSESIVLNAILAKKYNVINSAGSFDQWIKNKSLLKMPVIVNTPKIIEKLWTSFLDFPYPDKVEIENFSSKLDTSFLIVENIYKLFRIKNKISWSSDEILKNRNMFNKTKNKEKCLDKLETSANKKIDTTVQDNIEKLAERIVLLETKMNEINTQKNHNNKLIDRCSKLSDTVKSNEKFSKELDLDLNLNPDVNITGIDHNASFDEEGSDKSCMNSVYSRKNNDKINYETPYNDNGFQYVNNQDFIVVENKSTNKSFPKSCTTNGVGASLRTNEAYNFMSTSSQYDASNQFPQPNSRHFLDLKWQTDKTSSSSNSTYFQQNKQKTAVIGNNLLFPQNLSFNLNGEKQKFTSTNNSRNFLGIIGSPK